MNLRIELSGVDTARSEGMEVICRKSAMTKMARKLIAEGHDFCTPVKVMRGTTQCFNTAPLWKFASVVASEPSSGSVRLVKYKADPRFADKRGAA